MKTLKVIFAIVLMTGLFFTKVIAGNEPASEELLRNGIVTAISYPKTAQENLIEGSVELYFSIGKDGKILIKKIACSDPAFELSIKKDLEKIKVDIENDEPEKVYSLKILFDLI